MVVCASRGGIGKPATPIIGAVSAMRSNGQRPASAADSMIAAPIEWQRPNQGCGHEGPKTSSIKAARSRS